MDLQPTIVSCRIFQPVPKSLFHFQTALQTVCNMEFYFYLSLYVQCMYIAHSVDAGRAQSDANGVDKISYGVW